MIKYDGPDDIRHFSDYLTPIGEIVIAFSQLERRVTWAIESILRLERDEANALEESIKNVTIRIDILRTISIPHAKTVELKDRFLNIIERIEAANTYRNNILHGPWVGTHTTISAAGVSSAAMKSRFAGPKSKKKEPKPRSHFAYEMRNSAVSMLDLCRDIQRWILETCPNAENRVP
jgi:hypothetical protein